MRVSASSGLAVAAAALVSRASAENYLGFNSGATLPDNSAKFKADWVQEFTTAQNLEGAPGTFNAVRLYTNIQAYSTSSPIEAFQAAIETKTKILLGVWASGTGSISNELAALKAAVDAQGSALTDLVIGISIGSEDLYRNSVTGVTNKAGVGADPSVIVGFISDYKKAFAGTALANTPIGHVDTWDAWVNGTNKPVLDAVDWLGVDEYPYYETGKNNTIKNSGQLFDAAYQATIGAAGGKPVWVTETGWPATGPDWDLAVPSVENAKYYWNEIGCRDLFGKTPTFWYNLRDSNPDNTMKFAITSNLSTTPLFDLSCPTTFETPTSSSSSGSASPSSGSSGNSPSSSSSSSSSQTRGSAPGSSSSVSPSSGGSGSSSGGSGSPSGGSGSSSGGSNNGAPSGAAPASTARLSSMAIAGVAIVAGIAHLCL